MKTYAIYRHYSKEGIPARRMRSGLTLKQAQEHCNDPETSSKTAKRGRGGCQYGEWFDGYTEE